MKSTEIEGSVLTSNASKKMPTLDFDDLLEKAGGLGRYQILHILLIFLPVSFCSGYMSSTVIFQMAVPRHWCRPPAHLLDNQTHYTYDQWMNLTIPRLDETGEFSECEMYPWITDDNGTLHVLNNVTQGCVNGWDYDHSQYISTVATSFDWVCDKGHYSPLLISMFTAGNTVGTFFLPILADKVLGRRLVFYLSLAIHIVFTLPIVLVSSFPLHIALRFLSGLAFESYYLMPYIICLELTPVEYRALNVVLSFIAWTFGMCSTSLMVWLMPRWTYLAISTCVPCLLGFLYLRILPESPRWLLTKGRLKECTDIINEIIVKNGVTEMSREHVHSEVNRLIEEQPEQVPLTHVFIYPKLRVRALMLFILCHGTFLIYGVLLLGINVLPDSAVLSHFFLSLSELPSNFLGGAFVHFLGRRFSFIVTFLVIGVLLVCAPFTAHNPWLLLFVLAMIKLFATQGLYVIFVMAAEVFPTPIRTTGSGITLVFGLLGMVLAPQILHAQQNIGGNFKYWVMLGVTGVCLLASLPTPETLGLPLPQTFKDSENLSRGRPFTKWIHHWNYKNFPAYGSRSRQASLSQEHSNFIAKDRCREDSKR